jgi:monoterpene epsilon-lactone hydrolase
MRLAEKIMPRLVRATIKPIFNPRIPIPLQRRWLELTSRSMLAPRSCRYEASTLGGRPAECVRAPGPLNRNVLLYLHGGAYCLGSPRTHRSVTGRLAQLTGATVWVPDYRLAPEHPYPAPLQDALAAYRALLDHGVAPQRIALGGDSAGGHLALSLLLALREAGLPQPAAAVLLSPWTDAALDGPSVAEVGPRDPMLNLAWSRACGVMFRGDIAVDDPRVHLLGADLQGLAPLRIEVGSEEILLSDAERLAQAAEAAGVEVSYRRWDGMWHVFQVHGGLLRAADESLAGIAGWLKERWVR